MKLSKLLPVIILIGLLLPFVYANSAGASAPTASPEKITPSDLTMEDFFRIRPFIGKSALNFSFSKSDRYIAFIWNPFNEVGNRLNQTRYGYRGYDLYIYDTQKGTTTRVTSIEKMKAFDPPEDYEKFIKKRDQVDQEDKKLQEMIFAQRDYLLGKKVDLSAFENEEIESLKKELAEEKKKELEKKEAEKKEAEKKKEDEKTVKEKSGDLEKKDEKIDEKKDEKKAPEKKETEKELELWELRDKLKEKKEKDGVKLNDLYPGVYSYMWSKVGDELIFQYRGDLYRYIVPTNQISRLTMTDDFESIISYMKDGSGYYFQKENKVFKVKFNSSYVQQINHQLNQENKFGILYTTVSPDDKWMIIVASKTEGGPAIPRQVNMLDYKKRFAEPTKTPPREVPDDRRNQPTLRLILREIQSTNYGKEPDSVFEIPGGDVWYQNSPVIWTEDGSRYAFTTWEREKGEYKIWIGSPTPGKKPEILFETKENIGFQPDDTMTFSEDGKTLATILYNEAGFQQPFLFDVNSKTKRELIKGNFETISIIGFDKSNRCLYVVSAKDDPSTDNVYRVSLNSGEMTPLGKPGYKFTESTISHNGKWLAADFGNWNQLTEMYLINTTNGQSKVLTESHRKEIERYSILKPELFKYKNRNGDMISAMIFKPLDWKPEDKRPGIVYMYGGPLGSRHSVMVNNYSPLGYFFQMIMAIKHGYVTICIDPRGESLYGRKFGESNFEKPGKAQVEDLEDLVAFIKTGFGVDTARLGIHGWSFGGFQTLTTMFTSPDTFACGIAAAGPTEWENYNSWYSGAVIGKSVRGKPSLRQYSLIPLAKNLKKPLLLVHGMMDSNVLFQDTVNVYRALLESGKEKLVDLFLDPEGEHHLGGAVIYKGICNKWESFFVQHLGEYKK